MTWIPKQLIRTQIEERRLAGGKLLKKGRLSKAQIAHKLGASRAAVIYWARRKKFGGLRRLQSRKSSGRPPKRTPQQQRTLLRCLKRGALRAGFPTDRWTLRRIQAVIKREFDIADHPNSLSRFLRNLGWTPQLPVPRAAERDDKLVEAWLRHDWPRIKKARRIGADIVFFDEVGCSFLEPVGHTWAPCGKPPVLRRVTYDCRVLSTAVGLMISGQVYKRHFNKAINSEAVVETLKHLRRHILEPFIVVWDRASIHRSKKVMAYLAEYPAIHVEGRTLRARLLRQQPGGAFAHETFLQVVKRLTAHAVAATNHHHALLPKELRAQHLVADLELVVGTEEGEVW